MSTADYIGIAYIILSVIASGAMWRHFDDDPQFQPIAVATAIVWPVCLLVYIGWKIADLLKGKR